jgi:hypothetical protein
LQAAAEFASDLLLQDAMMPGMEGRTHWIGCGLRRH